MTRNADHSSLPPGWTECRLDALVGHGGLFTDGDWVLKEHLQRPGDDVRLLQLGNLGEGELKLRSERWISDEVADELGCTFLAEGDVLISRMAEPLARAAVLPTLPYPTITAVDVAILRVDRQLASPDFFALVMNTPMMRNRAEQHATGTTRKRISRKNLGALMVPLPPRPEQDRIVEAVEARLGELDAGDKALTVAEQRLDQFRESILAAAVTGRLARQKVPTESAKQLLADILARREDMAGPKAKPPATPSPPPGVELPKGWLWATVDQLSTRVQYGSSAKTGTDPNGVPVLRMGNIVDGTLRLDKLKYLPAAHEEFPDLFLEAGDVLFNRTNSPELVGKAAVFDNEVAPCSFASYLIRVRLVSGYRPELVVYFLSSALGRTWVRSVVSQQVGQANVNGTKLKHLTVPLPPLDAQDEVCRQAEAQLRSTAEARRAIHRARRQSRALRSAILMRAAQGELAAQDLSDPGASRLLAGYQDGGLADRMLQSAIENQA